MSHDPLPTVSVVIPAYNAAGFIEKTLDSVRLQTYRDYEIIVVDDGSSDHMWQVVERYFQRYSIRGRCIRQQNKKIAGARNTGMYAARGTFIALLDHDDLWYPEKLSTVMRHFELQPEVDLICHNENIVKDGRCLRRSHRGPARENMYERLLFSGNELSPSASVFRKDKALSIGGFRETADFDTAEDYDFWMRLSKIARFHFIDDVLGEYQVVERAASRRIKYHHTNLENMLKDHFSAYSQTRDSFISRIRIRKRLSAVYRSAATQLIANREFPDQQCTYVMKMLREYPIDPRNVARALHWLIYARRTGSLERG
jgi:glycosyltransferase involved in cell wall biosynthesis